MVRERHLSDKAACWTSNVDGARHHPFGAKNSQSRERRCRKLRVVRDAQCRNSFVIGDGRDNPGTGERGPTSACRGHRENPGDRLLPGLGLNGWVRRRTGTDTRPQAPRARPLWAGQKSAFLGPQIRDRLADFRDIRTAPPSRRARAWFFSQSNRPRQAPLALRPLSKDARRKASVPARMSSSERISSPVAIMPTNPSVCQCPGRTASGKDCAAKCGHGFT